ncbi:MAG: class I SAM-dependent methyltransferase [Deferrisomatales bacterium]|nr:class I SAM-dependent methyltransferase [Deferrisomatales bacterium]
MSETDAIRARYARRKQMVEAGRYGFMNAAHLQAAHERQRALRSLLERHLSAQLLAHLRVLEVGCGGGGNLLEFVQIGFDPSNIVGVELLEDRVEVARSRLPLNTRVLAGDATQVDLGGAVFDIVYQSLVFSSILDHTARRGLADRMWKLLRPGGIVLWYDFIYDNPTNPDVRGVPLKEVRELFPLGKLSQRRVTLAPPIARRVARLHPALCSIFNVLCPFLCTHVLCSIVKTVPGATAVQEQIS